MSRIRYATFYLCAVIGVEPCYAQISVSISPTFSAIAHNNELLLDREKNETFELPSTPLKDKYVLVVEVKSGALEMIAFDQINVDRNEANPVFLLNKTLNGLTVVPIPASTSGRGVVVSFFNDSISTRQLRYVVFRLGTRSASVRNQIQRIIEIPLIALAKFYRVPKFRVIVTPCGTINAYSAPDITLCSELISDLVEKDMIDALYPILYHELAHTLLRMWRLPGYNNEDFADEFAAAMLARFFPDHIRTFSAYLESRDSTTEAVVQLTEGSKHTLSIQRARNMRAALNKVNELEARWGNLLKPYELRPDRNPRKKQ